MRLRTFTARTTMEAIALVRTHLGPSAIIVSTQEDDTGMARVTAALDESEINPPTPTAAADGRFAKPISEALTFHGAGPELVETIVETAALSNAETAVAALAEALAKLYRFAPLSQKAKRAVALVGPQGSGKTVTAAKLAARAVLGGERVRLITTDTARAGAVAQLETFARILDTPFQAVDGPDQLAAALAAVQPSERVIVDTSGVNPFSAGDRRELDALLVYGNAEPVLVLAAGGDVTESMATAEIFRDLGCARLIVSRIDTVRRLGSIVAIAGSFSQGLAEAGVAADIADGLMPFTPMLFARLLMPKGAL
jgi:flagellar biosynthesis protein FlhF